MRWEAGLSPLLALLLWLLGSFQVEVLNVHRPKEVKASDSVDPRNLLPFGSEFLPRCFMAPSRKPRNASPLRFPAESAQSCCGHRWNRRLGATHVTCGGRPPLRCAAPGRRRSTCSRSQVHQLQGIGGVEDERAIVILERTIDSSTHL